MVRGVSAVVVLMGLGAYVFVYQQSDQSGPPHCVVTGGSGESYTMAPEQAANAATIAAVASARELPDRAVTIALATAMQEAKLYNAASEAVPESFEYTDSAVSYSDHDSVGLFQQRTSMGWGTVEELMDPATSASKFYNTLAGIDGWENMSIAEAAQSVQVSAYPDYYAQWEGLAWDIIDAYQSAS